jgi:hypothetical protein
MFSFSSIRAAAGRTQLKLLLAAALGSLLWGCALSSEAGDESALVGSQEESLLAHCDVMTSEVTLIAGSIVSGGAEIKCSHAAPTSLRVCIQKRDADGNWLNLEVTPGVAGDCDSDETDDAYIVLNVFANCKAGAHTYRLHAVGRRDAGKEVANSSPKTFACQ